MELTDKLYEQIARYVNNEMDAEEKVLFEVEIKQNPKLAAEIELYKEISSTCESADKKMNTLLQKEEKKITDDRIQQMISQARKEWEQKNENVFTPSFSQKNQFPSIEKSKTRKTILLQPWTMMAAAVLTGIVVVSVMWLAQNKTAPSITVGNKHQDTVTTKEQSTSVIVANDTGASKIPKPAKETDAANTQKLFAAYFKPDESPIDKIEGLEEPFSFYNNKQYNDAVEAFEMMKATLDTRGQEELRNKAFYIHYYLGLSYMASGVQNKNAVSELKVAIKQSFNEKQKQDAQWYLALAYLKTGNKPEAILLLNQIANNKTEYSAKAKQLSNSLNSN